MSIIDTSETFLKDFPYWKPGKIHVPAWRGFANEELPFVPPPQDDPLLAPSALFHFLLPLSISLLQLHSSVFDDGWRFISYLRGSRGSLCCRWTVGQAKALRWGAHQTHHQQLMRINLEARCTFASREFWVPSAHPSLRHEALFYFSLVWVLFLF